MDLLPAPIVNLHPRPLNTNPQHPQEAVAEIAQVPKQIETVIIYGSLVIVLVKRAPRIDLVATLGVFLQKNENWHDEAKQSPDIGKSVIQLSVLLIDQHSVAFPPDKKLSQSLAVVLVPPILANFVDVSSFGYFLIIDGPDAEISGDFILGDKQVDEASVVVVKLQVVPVLDVVLHAIFAVRVDVGVKKVQIGIEVIGRQLAQDVGIVGAGPRRVEEGVAFADLYLNVVENAITVFALQWKLERVWNAKEIAEVEAIVSLPDVRCYIPALKWTGLQIDVFHHFGLIDRLDHLEFDVEVSFAGVAQIKLFNPHSKHQHRTFWTFNGCAHVERRSRFVDDTHIESYGGFSNGSEENIGKNWEKADDNDHWAACPSVGSVLRFAPIPEKLGSIEEIASKKQLFQRRTTWFFAHPHL